MLRGYFFFFGFVGFSCWKLMIVVSSCFGDVVIVPLISLFTGKLSLYVVGLIDFGRERRQLRNAGVGKTNKTKQK